ncbi:MAG: DUF6174 domain-containing protein [Acidobacteriota bacterium]
MRLIFLLIPLLIAAGCNKEQVLQSDENDSYAKWSSYGYHNYTVDQTRQCYCINGAEAMKVVVRNDTVMSVTRLSDNKELSHSEARWYMPVDSLFKKILNPGHDSIVVSFNLKYGYPEKVDINPQLHPVDGGVLYLTSNLRIP